jgi:hypothetical protein
MRRTGNYFLFGVITAVIAVAIFSGNSFFRSVFAGDERGRLPRELRLGNEIGIISSEELTKSRLNRNISKTAFSEKIFTILELLGSPETVRPEELARSGIFTGKRKSAQISRAEAVEAMARVVIHLANKSLLALPENAGKSYKDYRLNEKYSQAINYLQGKFIVRGYPDGSLGARKNLSTREAIFLIYRLYEAISSDLMSKRTIEGISFIDIPLSHPVMDAIKNLTQAGAFDKVMLRPSFDGESYMSSSDLNEIISGICGKAGKETDLIRMKTIFAETRPDGATSRRQLALVLEYLLDTFAKDRLNAEKTSYTDVTIEQPEFEALLKLAGCGITMGYGNGKFSGNESVTWFESSRLLNEVVKYAAIAVPVIEKHAKLAEKSDIENF